MLQRGNFAFYFAGFLHFREHRLILETCFIDALGRRDIAVRSTVTVRLLVTALVILHSVQIHLHGRLPQE